MIIKGIKTRIYLKAAIWNFCRLTNQFQGTVLLRIKKYKDISQEQQSNSLNCSRDHSEDCIIQESSQCSISSDKSFNIKNKCKESNKKFKYTVCHKSKYEEIFSKTHNFPAVLRNNSKNKEFYKNKNRCNYENSELKEILETKNTGKLKNYLEKASSPLSVLGIYNYLKPPQIACGQRRNQTLENFKTAYGKRRGQTISRNSVQAKSTIESGINMCAKTNNSGFPSFLKGKGCVYRQRANEIRELANQSMLNSYNKTNLCL